MLKQQIISQLLLLVESHLHFLMNINTLSKPQLLIINLLESNSNFHLPHFLFFFVLKHIDGTEFVLAASKTSEI
jgi:hypothetical protein